MLNCFPKQMAPAVESDLNDIQPAAARAQAKAALAVFSQKYGIKYPKGVACRTRDTYAMQAHPMTSRPNIEGICAPQTRPLGPVNMPCLVTIESVLATVRHRTVRTKGEAVCRKRQQTDGLQP